MNIDWLEMYCLEPSEPRGVDYFAGLGFEVKERGYGTKHWSQVFTICDDAGNEFMEVRRAPRSGAREHRIMPAICVSLTDTVTMIPPHG